MTAPWIPALLVFAAVVALSIALFILVEDLRAWQARRKVRSRIGELLHADTAEEVEANAEIFRSEDGRMSGLFETASSLFPGMSGLPGLLEKADVSWSASGFLLLTLGAAAGGLLAGLFLDQGLLVAGLLTAIGAWLPYAYVSRKRVKRLQEFEEIFPEAVDMLGRAIRAGHPVSAGMQMVGQEIPDPVGGEFRHMFEEQRFGVSFHDVLMGLVDRVDLIDVRIFATALLVQREVGGNLAEILDNISTMIRTRFKIRRQLRTYTAQGRLSGIIIGVLPIVVGLIVYAMNPPYLQFMFEHPTGRAMLAGAAMLQILGYFWIRKIVNIEI